MVIVKVIEELLHFVYELLVLGHLYLPFLQSECRPLDLHCEFIQADIVISIGIQVLEHILNVFLGGVQLVLIKNTRELIKLQEAVSI